MMLLFFFFFSSRRRHTRLVSDWSSDVCSSDLSTQQLDQYKLRGGSEAHVMPTEHRSHRSVYRRHRDEDEDRGSRRVKGGQQSITGTISAQGPSLGAHHRAW